MLSHLRTWLRRSRMLALLAGVVLALTVTSTAGASGSSRPSCAIDEYGNCLAVDPVDVYYEGDWVGDYGVTGDGNGNGNQCRTVSAQRYGNSIAGFNLYRYWESVAWCWSGGLIRSIHRSRWPEINAPLWQFDGHIDTNCNQSEDCSGRAGLSTTTVWSVGQFHVCGVYNWLCRYKYPRVAITVNGYGGWSYDTSG
jgi:hypothetical protein